MRDDLSPKERRAIQKAEMLKEFGQVKKNYYIASILVLLIGFTGAHRMYLGQIAIGIIMFGVWIIIGVSNARYPESGTISETYSPLFILAALYSIFVFVEMLQIISITDKVNDKIRREVEKKHYV